MLRAVDFTLAHRGPHGLPRSGFSDWNDTLNVDHGSGKAESVWTAMQFCRAMLDLAELCRKLDRPADARRFAGLHASMAAVDQRARLGRRLVRAGLRRRRAADRRRRRRAPRHRPDCPELERPGRGRAARSGPSRRCVRRDEKLNTRFGVALLWPPYDGADARVRGTSTYVPGAKENGGIFCHANAWSIVAAAMLGHGDEAYKYYRQILPLARTDSDLYMVEPYTYPQNICGPGAPVASAWPATPG